MDNNITEFDDYQDKALATAIYPIDSEIVYPALGLNGEAGEVAEKVKKVIRDQGGDFSDPVTVLEITKELGDVLWYLSAIASDLGMKLSDVARINLDKLENRRKLKQLKGSGDNR